jgi:hypothetical protein
MPTPTYIPIATTTASGAAFYTFSSIPATYTDLLLTANIVSPLRRDTHMQFNGDTATNYSFRFIYGEASSVIAGVYNTQSDIYVSEGGTNSTHLISINNYSNTTTYKTVLTRAGYPMDKSITTSVGIGQVVGTWRSTAAINAIKIFFGTTFSDGTNLTLYGIKAA